MTTLEQVTVLNKKNVLKPARFCTFKIRKTTLERRQKHQRQEKKTCSIEKLYFKITQIYSKSALILLIDVHLSTFII